MARPSVLLVAALALAGCGPARTPNLDRLADLAVVFDNAYSTSPWTPPSAVSIFTGNYATSYPCSALARKVQILVPDQDVSPAGALRDRGYDTAVVNENVHVSFHNCPQGFEAMYRSEFDSAFTDEANAAIRGVTGGMYRSDPSYRHTYRMITHLLGIPLDRRFLRIGTPNAIFPS